MLTETEFRMAESHLRKLRKEVFKGTDAEQILTESEIIRVKSLCADNWRAQECQTESAYARVMWM